MRENIWINTNQYSNYMYCVTFHVLLPEISLKNKAFLSKGQYSRYHHQIANQTFTCACIPFKTVKQSKGTMLLPLHPISKLHGYTKLTPTKT